MLIKEYRICMPMTSEEYNLAQLYMVAKASQEETGKKAGEGIEIVKNEGYSVDSEVNKYKMPSGQYTEKVMHLKSHIPKFISALLPVSMMDIHETSWNAFPHCKTEYTNAYFKDKLTLSVETIHADDRGTQENAVGLSPDDLSKRKVDYINIACEDAHVKMEKGFDPTKFQSQKTNRGPLKANFIADHDPIMTCYKVVKLRFKIFGLQTKVEQWGHQYGFRNVFLESHRKLFCWIDEWYGLKIDDIRAMEDETKRINQQKLEEGKQQEAAAAAAK